jgi:hypothetical protein
MTLADTSGRRGGNAYAVSLVDIRFDQAGRGAGTLAYAANLIYNDRTGAIAVENYGGDTTRLTNVRSMPAR